MSFLESQFGPYPVRVGGAIVPDSRKLAFALETQTRPVYSRYFFPFGGDFVIVHELAHQWFGDLVAVDRWQHVWLNEGFATYAEWLWDEHEGFATPQEILESLWHEIGPAIELLVGRRSATRALRTSSTAPSTSAAR